jgi:hypothetical protein
MPAWSQHAGRVPQRNEPMSTYGQATLESVATDGDESGDQDEDDECLCERAPAGPGCWEHYG